MGFVFDALNMQGTLSIREDLHDVTLCRTANTDGCRLRGLHLAGQALQDCRLLYGWL
jgi:uncharacterized protein YjbI with pentapeptide repeats